MQIKRVFTRFYRSFNFDYLRKANPKVTDRPPWETLDNLWVPHVSMSLERDVTTVIGENESGKTHLLGAIKKGLTGKGIAPEDLCRYSKFFSVERGQRRLPDFGFEFTELSPDVAEVVAAACGLEQAPTIDRFWFFRSNGDTLTIYLPSDEGPTRHQVDEEQVEALEAILPVVYKIDAKVPLPACVPLTALTPEGNAGAVALERSHRMRMSRTLKIDWFKDDPTFTANAPAIRAAVAGGDRTPINEKEVKLARQLLLDVARVDPGTFGNLLQALEDQSDAYANSLIKDINRLLRTSLNFPRWWAQDRQFELRVSPREMDLVFTVHDRTESEYSFLERSSGLRYFLSYYIQYLAHESRGESGVLLMDEPDAYLSSTGQQDLLKIFNAFANPDDDDRKPVQVVYVTHSPFLLDKNHSERIRVLEKGVGAEGTRVIRKASANHYEPLRSALGSLVGEAAFVGNCNLLVEGGSDQIILAAASRFLTAAGASRTENLDLNQVTIVPAGGASHVPYMAFLIRGRDVDVPPLVVLLDGDKPGNDARKALGQSPPYRNRLVDDKFVLQVNEVWNDIQPTWANVNPETEALLPLPIAVEAARVYLSEYCSTPEDRLSALTKDKVVQQDGGSCLDGVEEACKSVVGDVVLDKIGFARAVAEVLRALSEDAAKLPADAQAAKGAVEGNFLTLFKALTGRVRAAEREQTSASVARAFDRARKTFLQDYPQRARREDVILFFERVEAGLDESREGDNLRAGMKELRRDFHLDDSPTELVEDFERLAERLEQLQYASKVSAEQ